MDPTPHLVELLQVTQGCALFLGILFTVLVQSSSVTTSLIVPLVGAGILTLE